MKLKQQMIRVRLDVCLLFDAKYSPKEVREMVSRGISGVCKNNPGMFNYAEMMFENGMDWFPVRADTSHNSTLLAPRDAYEYIAREIAFSACYGIKKGLRYDKAAYVAFVTRVKHPGAMTVDDAKLRGQAFAAAFKARRIPNDPADEMSRFMWNEAIRHAQDNDYFVKEVF